MADSDKTLQLKIDLAKTGQGDTEAVAGINKVEQAAKEEGKAAAESGISNRELGRVLTDVGNVAAPGAGRALAELRFGPLGAALALVGAFEMLKKQIEDTNKEADELDAKELETHRTAIENVQKAWDDARQEFQKYEIAVKEAGQEKDPAADRLKRIKEVSAAETEAHLKRVEELNREYVLFLKAHGASPEKIAGAEESARREEDAIRDAAANRNVAQIQSDIDRRRERQSDFDAVTAAENERVGRANAALAQANLDKKGATDANANDVLGKKAAEAEAKLSEAEATRKRIFDVEGALGGVPPQVKEAQDKIVAAAQQALSNAEADRDRVARALEAANKAIANAETEKNAAEAALARAKSAGTENASRITQETSEVATGRAVEAQKEQDQQRLAILHTQAGRMPQTLEQLAIATGKTHEQIENILTQILDHHLNLVTVLNQLAGQFAAQQGQISNARSMYTSG